MGKRSGIPRFRLRLKNLGLVGGFLGQPNTRQAF